MLSLSRVFISLVIPKIEVILLLDIIILLTRMRPIFISLLGMALNMRLIVIIMVLWILVICIAVRPIRTANHANIIGLKWLKFFIFIPITWSCAILNYDGFIH